MNFVGKYVATESIGTNSEQRPLEAIFGVSSDHAQMHTEQA